MEAQSWQKEQISVAYLHAIATRESCTIASWNVDKDGVDATLRRGHLMVDIQLKCTQGMRQLDGAYAFSATHLSDSDDRPHSTSFESTAAGHSPCVRRSEPRTERGVGNTTSREPGSTPAPPAGKAARTLTCAYLAAAVLAGLLANTLLGWWWLDPVVAVGIAGLEVQRVDQPAQRGHLGRVRRVQVQGVEELLTANAEQVGHRHRHALLSQHGMDLGLEPGPQRDQLGPMPHRLQTPGGQPQAMPMSAPAAWSSSYLSVSLGTALSYRGGPTLPAPAGRVVGRQLIVVTAKHPLV